MTRFRATVRAPRAVEACSLPAGYQVEQYGEVADGTRVLVILPIGAIATGYRLFYGPPSRVAEYPVSNTGFTSINRAWYFYVGELSYGVVFSSGVTESPSRLVIDHGGGPDRVADDVPARQDGRREGGGGRFTLLPHARLRW